MTKPGTYRLTRDVSNPKPDRRAKRDWTKQVCWLAGTELLVVDVSTPDDDAGPRYQLRCVGEPVIYQLHAWNSAFALLLNASEPVEENLDSMCSRLHVAPALKYFLGYMVGSGQWTLADCEKHYEAYLNHEGT